MSKPQKIFIASDHAGFELKEFLLKECPELPWQNLGPHNKDSVDYPDYANKVCTSLKDAPSGFMGVLICGSGQGMAIRANRFPYIRAALCFTEEAAKLSRQHNDANVLCLGSRMVDQTLAKKILLMFLNESFEGGRHEQRVRKLSENC